MKNTNGEVVLTGTVLRGGGMKKTYAQPRREGSQEEIAMLVAEARAQGKPLDGMQEFILRANAREGLDGVRELLAAMPTLNQKQAHDALLVKADALFAKHGGLRSDATSRAIRENPDLARISMGRPS